MIDGTELNLSDMLSRYILITGKESDTTPDPALPTLRDPDICTITCSLDFLLLSSA